MTIEAKQACKSKDQNSQKHTHHNKGIDQCDKQQNKDTVASKESTPIHEIVIINDDESHKDPKPKDPHPQQQKRDLTLVTGPCILRTIETRFLSENARVKSFYQAKIETLEEKLSHMDLSRYENIVLHIRGHDIDARINHSEFKHKYTSLLESLSDKKCKVVISGLLPRKRINMKPYNIILKELSTQFDASFIDNHDSFILASGDLPFESFQDDKVNLKFPGTRQLIQNINKSCVILPLTRNPHGERNMSQLFRRKSDKANRYNAQKPFSH